MSFETKTQPADVIVLEEVAAELLADVEELAVEAAVVEAEDVVVTAVEEGAENV